MPRFKSNTLIYLDTFIGLKRDGSTRPMPSHMKIVCSDGSTRDFIALSYYLESHGFDPSLLERDDYMLELGFPPHLSVIGAFRLACAGAFVPEYFRHWSKDSKKKNSANISAKELSSSIKWLSIDPSFECITQESLVGRMSRFTFLSRFLLNMWGFICGDLKSTPTIKALLFGERMNDFKFMHGYRNRGYSFIENPGVFVLHLDGENDGNFLVHSSLLGWAGHVYISLND